MKQVDKKKLVTAIILAVLIIVELCIVIHLMIGFNHYNESLDNQSTKLELVEDAEITNYENIQTTTFTFKDVNNHQEKELASGYIDFSTIVSVVNEYLHTLDYRVCGIGIIGSKLYIEVDTTDRIDDIQKLNVVSIESGLSASDWIKLTEVILSQNKVCADNLITYRTDIGTQHLMYVYLEK